MALLKYVDDNSMASKVNFDTAIRLEVLGESHRVKHAVELQNVFRTVIRRAESKGMKVNTDKTNVICISDAQSYTPSAYVLDSDGVRIDSGNSLKIVGFHFSN